MGGAKRGENGREGGSGRRKGIEGSTSLVSLKKNLTRDVPTEPLEPFVPFIFYTYLMKFHFTKHTTIIFLLSFLMAKFDYTWL